MEYVEPPSSAQIRARRLQRRAARLLGQLRERLEPAEWELVLRLEEALNERTCVLIDAAGDVSSDVRCRVRGRDRA